MNAVSDRISGGLALLRGTLITGVALGLGACGAIQNMAPDPASFRLPDRSAYLPAPTTAFAGPVSSLNVPVGPADLVDGRGVCSAGATEATSTAPRAAKLEMTECEVVRVLGQPQSVELNPGAGRQRSVVLTYSTGEQSGIYQFVGGRLVSIERANEPAPPAAKKTPAKKAPA
jgi:hypothetical protein